MISTVLFLKYIAIGFAVAALVGSMYWWLIRTTSIRRIAHRLSDNSITTINRIMALILIGIAMYLLITALQS